MRAAHRPTPPPQVAQVSELTGDLGRLAAQLAGSEQQGPQLRAQLDRMARGIEDDRDKGQLQLHVSRAHEAGLEALKEDQRHEADSLRRALQEAELEGKALRRDIAALELARGRAEHQLELCAAALRQEEAHRQQKEERLAAAEQEQVPGGGARVTRGGAQVTRVGAQGTRGGP